MNDTQIPQPISCYTAPRTARFVVLCWALLLGALVAPFFVAQCAQGAWLSAVLGIKLAVYLSSTLYCLFLVLLCALWLHICSARIVIYPARQIVRIEIGLLFRFVQTLPLDSIRAYSTVATPLLQRANASCFFLHTAGHSFFCPLLSDADIRKLSVFFTQKGGAR